MPTTRTGSNPGVIYVPPDGITEVARIALVGEAPGAEEEAAGIPFVGQSGKLIRLCMAASEVSPNRVLLTNAVMVRPVNVAGKNRKPTDAEIDSWVPILRRQLLACHVVVALGQSALRAVSQCSVPGQILIAMDHPNYVIRRGSLREEWCVQLTHILRGEY